MFAGKSSYMHTRSVFYSACFISTNTWLVPKEPPTPWVTPEIMKAKTHNLERTWRRSRTHLDRSSYKHQCHLYNRMMTNAKSKYLAEVISENSDNPRRQWNSINNILYRISPPALPEFKSVKSLCDHFSKYYVDTIVTICFYKVQKTKKPRKNRKLDPK